LEEWLSEEAAAMRIGLRSLLVATLGALAALAATPVSAVPATSQFVALLDLDNNPATGCTVATADGPFKGVEVMLVTTVDITQSPPQVISVMRQTCTAGSFGAPVAVTSPFTPPWSVGANNGTGGADAVETYLPLAGLGAGTTIHLAFTAQVVGGTGKADATLTTTGTPAGDPILLSAAPIASVPALGTVGLVLLALLVAACALRLLGSRGAAGRGAAAALLLFTLGLGLAAAFTNITPDGNVADWSGIPPLAVDPTGDAPINADLVAEFGVIQNNILFLRFDAQIVGLPAVTTTSPVNGAMGVAGNSTVTINFNEPVNVTASAFKLDCPSGTPVPFTVSPAAPGNASTFTLTPSATLPAGVTCQVTVVAAQVSDDSGLNPANNDVFFFATDGPPIVTSTVPAAGATQVSLTAPITINFSKPVNVTASAFTLECPAGTPAPFTLSPAPPGGVSTFTLTPTAPLPQGTVCTVTVVAAQVTDTAAGTHPAADFPFTFTTDTAPTVTATSPVTGATSVPLNTTVSFTFNKAVNAAAGAFKLECPAGTPVAFSVSPALPGNATTFTLTPAANLPAGTLCAATAVASQITDAAGTNLGANFGITFTTDTAPTVTSTTPANGATNQEPNTTITVNFSKAVNVTATAFTLECPVGTPQAFTVAPAPPGGATTFVLTPNANLPASTTCTVTAVASQITDVAAGTNLAANFVFTFTTGNPPSVTSTTPANGAVNVLANSAITLTFSKAVNVTATAFTLECPVGTPQAFTITPAPPGGVVTFTLTPSANLPAGAVCTVTAVASQITDTVAGLHPTANFVFTFTVDTPPTVTATAPAGGATSVPLNTTVVFTFSKAVNVTATAFTLACPTGTPVPFTLSPAPPGGATAFTLTPTANLPAGTVCTATAVAAQIADLAGTHLGADFPVSFTTDVAPTVTSTTPAAAATSVPLNTTVTFTFSKAVSVTASAFTLQCPSGTPVAFTLAPAPPGNVTTYTLTPTANLPAGTACVATAVAAQIADAVGTHLAANFTLSFTTDVAPTVTTTSPANGASGTSPSAPVTITFSKAVNVTGTAFTLQCPVGTPEAFTVSPAPPGGATTFTLTPSASLPVSTTCTVTAVASQITDVSAGTNLAANFTFTFTTGTPPTVTSTTPANGATNVLAAAPISITFSKAVNVTGTAFTLQCPTGTPQAFTLSPAPPGGVATFTLTPSAPLPAGTVCTVTVVASQVADTVNNINLAANFVFSFTVDTPPTVTAVNPANGATAVPLNSTVVFTFSKAVNVTGTAFTLQCPSGTPVAFTLSPAPPGGATAFTLTPSANLPAGTVCTATAVAAQITDLAGTHLGADFSASFTTDVAPTVTSTTPAAAATAVPLNSTVVFTFSKAVNVTGTAFTLQCPSGTPVAFTLAPAPPGNATTFTLTPSANLPAGTACVATAVATQIADAAGTHLAANFTLNFTTDVAPTVTSTTPANGASGVSPSTTVAITFSKAVNVTGTAFTLQCPAGTPEAFTIAPAPPGGATTFTLTPSASLPVSTTCTVTAVASQITDVSAGTNLAANFTFTFTTGTPPTVTSTTPANGATNVLATAPISITFSKAVNVTGTAFTLQCPTGTPQAFTLSPAPPGGVATFTLTPSAPLPATTVCTVTAVASQITDTVNGINLQANFTFSFTVDTPPTVTAINPANGATNVPLTSTVSFTFNEAVNVTASAFTLQCPSGTPQAFTLSPAPPGGATTFTLTPSANLPGGVVCTATAVASQIADAAGTHLAANVSSSFTIDTPPAVTTTTPANGATAVLASTTVTVNFNKAVNVTGTAFTLACPIGTPEAFTVAPAPPGGATSFTLTPTANLPAGAVCTVTVVASQVTDVSANTPLAANFTFSFTIDTPPTVTSTSPANGATSVPVASTVSVTFNKQVNVTGTAFTLQCPSGTPVAFTVTPASPATTFTLHPTANLPADTTCTATVVATQVADVAGTQLAANFTFTFSTPPTAVNDTYPEAVIGNVSINSSLISFSVLANDVFSTAVTITAFDATSANGGTVTMTTAGAGAGQFTYNPAAGFTGTDTFTYTITNAHGSSTATVTLTVSGIIWFINDNAGAGDGRLATPFNSLAAFQAINDGALHHPAANANIFLYDSATGYTGPATLLNGQKLIGQDATSTLSAITGLTPGASSAALPATGGGSPNKVSVTSSGNTVTLGSGNTVWGMTLGNATGTALTGASVGSLKLRDLTIDNTTGAAVSLASGALDAILNAVTSGGGTHGISLTTTTGSFDVEGSGASDPTNTTKGRTTARSGGGTLTLGSGGTIQNATSSGVLLSTATNVTLRNVVIQNNGGAGVASGGDGITVTNGSGLTLDNDLITGQAGNQGVHATGLSGFTMVHTQISNNATSTNAAIAANGVWNVRFDNLGGTSSIEACLFENTQIDPFGIVQTGAAAATLTADNSQFSDTATAAPGNVGLQVQTFNGSSAAVTVTNSSFLRNFSNGLEFLLNDSSGGSLTVGTSTFDANAIDINLDHQGAGQTVSFNIHDNTLRQTTGGLSNSIAIGLGSASTATTVLQGFIQNNEIGNAAVANSGSAQGNGLVITPLGAGTITAEVTGNSVVQVAGNDAFNMQPFQFTGTVNLTLTNNTFSVNTASINSGFGIDIIAGNDPSDKGTICANMTGNHANGNGSTVGSGLELLTGAGTPTVELQGYGGAAGNAGQITTFIDGANTVNPSPATVSATPGTIKAAPSPCPTPP
jgi:methionine-rich copper-binding protein CopC